MEWIWGKGQGPGRGGIRTREAAIGENFQIPNGLLVTLGYEDWGGIVELGVKGTTKIPNSILFFKLLLNTLYV